MEIGTAIKLFSLIPGLRSWAVKRFSSIEVTPKNGPGNNMFFRSGQDESRFVVKVNFRIKTYTDIDLVNLDLNYGKGYRAERVLVEINGNNCQTDGNFHLVHPFSLKSGKLYSIFMSCRFYPDGFERDYDNTKIQISMSAPEIPGIATKEFEFSMASGGELVPQETQKSRIF
jgi:hypothetical protein